LFFVGCATKNPVQKIKMNSLKMYFFINQK
jgi:hypothetical protein